MLAPQPWCTSSRFSTHRHDLQPHPIEIRLPNADHRFLTTFTGRIAKTQALPKLRRREGPELQQELGRFGTTYTAAFHFHDRFGVCNGFKLNTSMLLAGFFSNLFPGYRKRYVLQQIFYRQSSIRSMNLVSSTLPNLGSGSTSRA